jgi:hypothetical protein
MSPADPARERGPHEMLPAELRMAETRAEIEGYLIPEPDTFPRSQTMRLLTGRNGKAVAVGAFAALFAVKPRIALSLARFLPFGNLLPLALLAKRFR